MTENKPQILRSREAFTLLEMVIAITIFTIFMGTAIGLYNLFHRSLNQTADTRELLFESEHVVSQLTEWIKNYEVDYSKYTSGVLVEPLVVQRLNLIDPDTSEQLTLNWDQNNEQLFIQKNDETGFPKPGYEQPVLMHDEMVKIPGAEFWIYPPEKADPLGGDLKLDYHNLVSFDLLFERPSRTGKSLSINLKSSVSSRRY